MNILIFLYFISFCILQDKIFNFNTAAHRKAAEPSRISNKRKYILSEESFCMQMELDGRKLFHFK